MDFGEEIKREARKQYLKYFVIWFVAVAAVLALTIGVNVSRAMKRGGSGGNQTAPAERVFDYADVLTDEEEDLLRREIAKLEQQCHADLILVTIDSPVGLDDYTWERTMMNLADDFYDERAYGWDQEHGDGALLLDNWYEDEAGSQKGSWLSTSGKMERIIGSYEEGKVFSDMDAYIDRDPYKAYLAAMQRLAAYGDETGSVRSPAEQVTRVFVAVIISTVIALIYAAIHLSQKKAKDTTVATTYVLNGKPEMRIKEDNFLRKSVTSHRIESGSGGGGSRSGGGGGSYGSHHSSGGFSHGGGGHRR